MAAVATKAAGSDGSYPLMMTITGAPFCGAIGRVSRCRSKYLLRLLTPKIGHSNRCGFASIAAMAELQWVGEPARLHLRHIIPYSLFMETSHSDLQRQVIAEIDAYVAPGHPQDAVGSALPQSWFLDRLTEMRAAVVRPRNAKIRDGDNVTGAVVIKDVIVVVDDGVWIIVAYDPEASTFVLAAPVCR